MAASSFRAPREVTSCTLIMAPGTNPPQQMEKLGWSLREYGICFANCYSCLRASPVNSVSLRILHGWGPLAAVPSLAQADLKNGQTEVLTFGVLYHLGLKRTSMWFFQ